MEKLPERIAEAIAIAKALGYKLVPIKCGPECDYPECDGWRLF